MNIKVPYSDQPFCSTFLFLLLYNLHDIMSKYELSRPLCLHQPGKDLILNNHT